MDVNTNKDKTITKNRRHYRKESGKGQQYKCFAFTNFLLMECNKIKCKCGSNKFLNKRQTINTYKIKQAPKKRAKNKNKSKRRRMKKTRKEMKHIQTWKK